MDAHLTHHGLVADDVTEGVDEIRSWSSDVLAIRNMNDGRMLAFYNKGRHGLPFALIDGNSPWDMLLADTQAEGGLRSYTFSLPLLQTIDHNTRVLGNRVGSLASYAMLLRDLGLLY
ncbi:MAG: hypothetical protein JWM98_217 [Thermoleophilia bacterium]|nr:hypothetical protein [Thermoleophilia bacterium]